MFIILLSTNTEINKFFNIGRSNRAIFKMKKEILVANRKCLKKEIFFGL